MSARVDRGAVSFPAWVVTVTTAAGNTFRRVFLRGDKAVTFARGAQSRGGVAGIERMTLVRSRDGGHV